MSISIKLLPLLSTVDFFPSLLYLQGHDIPSSIFPTKYIFVYVFKKTNLKERQPNQPFVYYYISTDIRVFIGFNFKPILSGEKSSGEMQDGLKGLLGLTLILDGLYKPYPMRKYSIGINIAWGCSSVTIDPHAWTCNSANNYVKSKHVLIDILVFSLSIN